MGTKKMGEDYKWSRRDCHSMVIRLSLNSHSIVKQSMTTNGLRSTNDAKQMTMNDNEANDIAAQIKININFT